MNARNAKHNANGTIDLEYEHPSLGWIPFTASADDSEKLGRDLHAAALAGGFGGVAPHIPRPQAEIDAELLAREKAIKIKELIDEKLKELIAVQIAEVESALTVDDVMKVKVK